MKISDTPLVPNIAFSTLAGGVVFGGSTTRLPVGALGIVVTCFGTLTLGTATFWGTAVQLYDKQGNLNYDSTNAAILTANAELGIRFTVAITNQGHQLTVETETPDMVKGGGTSPFGLANRQVAIPEAFSVICFTNGGAFGACALTYNVYPIYPDN